MNLFDILQISLVYVSKSVKYIIAALGLITISSVLVVIFTSVGFPYNNDPLQPTKQRSFVLVGIFSVIFFFKFKIIVKYSES